MPNYDLGQAHGRVVIDYDDNGINKAERDLDRLRSKTGSYGDSAKKASGHTQDFSDEVSSFIPRVRELAARIASLNQSTKGFQSAVSSTLPQLRFLANNFRVLDGALRSNSIGKASAGFILARRAFGTFSKGIVRNSPIMLANLLGLRAVIHGVPKEMNSWPKAIRNVVALSAGLATLKSGISGIKALSSGGFAVPSMFKGIVDGAQNSAQSVNAFLSGISKNYNRVLSGANKSSRGFARGLMETWKASEGAVTGVAQMALGVVFAQRALTSGVKLWRTSAFVIERFTWAMGAAGIASLGFLKTMSGGTTLIRGAWDGMKQLSGAALLLPGALTAAGMALITASVGAKGMGKAFAAAVDPTADLGEATKNLSSSARNLVYQVRGVSQGWKDMQKEVQQELFEGTAGRFKQLSEKYLPGVTRGMKATASASNSLIHKFADFASQAKTVGSIETAFFNTARIVRNFGSAFKPALEGMRDIGTVGMAAIADYSKSWEGLTQKFANWAAAKQASGEMRRMIDDSIEGFKDLGSITANLGRTINNTFKPFYGGSVENALSRAADATSKWVDIMAPSGKGGKAVQGFVDHIQKMAEPWGDALSNIFRDMSPAFNRLLPLMEKFSSIAANEAKVIAQILGPALNVALAGVNALAPAIGVLVAAFSGLRTLNWVRKAGMFLASPFVQAAAAVRAFSSGIRNLGKSGKIAGNGVKGASAGLNAATAGAKGIGSNVIASYDRLVASINRAIAAQTRLNAAMAAGGRAAAGAAKAGAGAAAAGAAAKAKPVAEKAVKMPATVVPAGTIAGVNKLKGSVDEATKSTGRLRGALAGAGGAIAGFGGRMGAFTGGVRNAAGNLDSAGTATNRFKTALAGAGGAIGGLGGRIKNIGSSARETSDHMATAATRTKSFSREMAKAEAPVVKTQGRMSTLAKTAGSTATTAVKGLGSAAAGLAGILGGLGGIASIAAIGGIADVAISASQTSSAIKQMGQITTQQGQTFKSLRNELTMTKGVMTDGAMVKQQQAVQAEMDKTAAATQKSGGVIKGIFNGLDKVFGTTYAEHKKMADGISGGGTAWDRNRAAGQAARMEQEALSNSLQKLSMTQDDANKAVASGGAAYKSLIADLRASGDEGVAVANKFEGLRQKFEMVKNTASDASPLQRYSAAMDLMKESAGDTSAQMQVFRDQVGMVTGQSLNSNSAISQTAQVANALATELANVGPGAVDAAGGIDAMNIANAGLVEGQTALSDSLHNQITTMSQTGASFDDMVGKVGQLKQSFIENAVNMGANAQEAENLANAIFGVPDEKVLSITNPDASTVLHNLRAMGYEVNALPDGTIQISDNTPEVRAALQALGIEFSVIDGKIVINKDDIPAAKAALDGALNGHVTESKHLVHPDVPEAIAQLSPLDALTTESMHTVDTNGQSIFESLLEMNGVKTESEAHVNTNAPEVKAQINSLGQVSTTSPNNVLTNAPITKGIIMSLNGLGTTSPNNVPTNAPQAKGMIFGLNNLSTTSPNEVTTNVPEVTSSILGLNDLGTNTDHNVADNTAFVTGAILGLNALNTSTFHSVGDNTGSVAGAIAALNGQNTWSTHTITVVTTQVLSNVGGMPAPKMKTGGKIKGGPSGYKKLPGYAKGKRHKGYQLPKFGPGTRETDGFLALDMFSKPIARLDANEWIVNGKSSKKYKKELALINAGKFPKLPGFADGGGPSGFPSEVNTGVNVRVTGLNGNVAGRQYGRDLASGIDLSSGDIQAAAEQAGAMAAEAFQKMAVGAGVAMRSDKMYKDSAREYADALGIEFGKGAKDENERLQKEIEGIKDENQKEAKRRLIKDSDELQRIADREFEDFARNNKMEAYGYQAAKAFADGLSGGGNLISAASDGLVAAAATALAASGTPLALIGMAGTAIKGLIDVMQDDALWDTGRLDVVIYKILNAMTAGLLNGILSLIRNMLKFFGIEIKNVPIIGELYKIKDAANGATDALSETLNMIDAMNKLNYKNIGKSGASNINQAIASQVTAYSNVPKVEQVQSNNQPTGQFRDLVVNAPSDKASDMIQAATFEMRRV